MGVLFLKKIEFNENEVFLVKVRGFFSIKKLSFMNYKAGFDGREEILKK